MSDVKSKIMQVMTDAAALQDATLGSGYPFRMATWNIRCAMERKFPGVEWRSADLRKELIELAKEGWYPNVPTRAALARPSGAWR